MHSSRCTDCDNFGGWSLDNCARSIAPGPWFCKTDQSSESTMNLSDESETLPRMRMVINGEDRLGHSSPPRRVEPKGPRDPSIIFPFPLKISETPRPNGAERVSQRVNRGFAHLFTDGCWYRLRKFLRIYRGRVQGSCAFLRSSESSDRSLELQEGPADCIANQDGERQIASAISFHGEETVRMLLFSRISRSHK